MHKGLVKYFGGLVALALLTCSFTVQAQVKFSSDPSVFTNDVTTLLSASKNEAAVQSAQQFTGIWGSFSEPEKKRIIEVSQKLQKSKKLRSFPDFSNFFADLHLIKSKGMAAHELDTFLIICDKVIVDYDTRKFGAFLSGARLVMEKQMLFESKFNNLYFTGGTFSFSIADAAPADQGVMEETEAPKEEEQSWDAGWDTPTTTEESWGATEEPVVEETPVVAEEEVVLDYSIGYEAAPQPPVQGPVIVFEKTDLTLVTPYDSIQLKGVSGALRLSDFLFIADGGKVDWSSAGETGAYCELSKYNFPVKSYKFEAADAKLYYPARTDSVVAGVFKLNSQKYKDPTDKNWPRFISYKSNIPVKGLGDNIKYEGGLSLSGKRVYSSSLDEGYSKIEVLHNGVSTIRAVSNRFQLGDSIISSEFTSISVYQDKDSIYHPGAVFKYNKNTSKLRLTKKGGYRVAPFIDSYHKLEITADAMVWDMNTNKIVFEIVNARGQIAAVFESEEYFSEQKYSKLQGIYRFHPLAVIVGYSDSQKKKGFYANDVATAYKVDPKTMKGAMTSLMKQGFIDYNSRTGYIKLKDKARHYVLSRRDKKDYDNITFISISPSGGNAVLDLSTKELTVKGVSRVNISDSLNVTIVPDSNTIVIQQNRDFKFNGKINTAQFQFIGTDFQFNYDSFFVRMPTIDQIKLSVENKDSVVAADSLDEKKGGKQRTLGNELRYSSGTLYINKPDNKSSRKKFPEYPIFDATTGASVFFNKKQVASGSYDTTIKFEIPPFKVDSLSASDPAAIGFDGTFKSGNIFPDFQEKLVVMPDYSLGFKHDTPVEGYPLYAGKGKFFDHISLDNQGIRGNGRIEYLNTTLYSNDFVYFKDSVLTVGTNMDTKIGVNPQLDPSITFPDVQVQGYRLKWLVPQDSMMLSNTTEPFHLYKSTANMQGTLVNSEKGMFGLGVLFTRGSSSESLNFHFEDKKFGARNAGFSIKSSNPDKPALRATDVKLDFDLEANLATFKPEVEGFASTEFPYGQYRTSLDNGLWDLEKKKIFMTKPEEVDISKSYFYSIRPDQDSLVFNATNAIYEIEYLTLNIYGVPYINVCDSRVYPDSGKVFIEENAVMRTLTNSKLLCDTTTKYHNHYDGVLDVLGRNKFNGQTTYQYVNLGEDTLSIKFTNFKYIEGEKKKDGFYTVGKGRVSEEEKLHIGPKILYKGDVTMYARQKFLSFDGFVKLDLAGALSYSEWLKYQNSGATEHVEIDLKNAVAANGKPLQTGLCFDGGNSLYTTFISLKKNDADKTILPVTGNLNFDADSNEFAIGDSLKLSGRALKGNFLSYNDDKSTIKFGGNFDLLQPNSNVSLFAAGEGSGDLKDTLFDFNFLLAVGFKPASAQLEMLGKNMNILAASLPVEELDMNETAYAKTKDKEALLDRKLSEEIGEQGIAKYKEKKALGPVPLSTLSSTFSKGILLQEVEMKWSEEYKAFYSTGKIHVTSVMKNEVNRKIPGYVEIRKTIKGDVVNILLEASYGNWYFISYDDNRLAIVTGNSDLNDQLAAKSKGEMPDRSKFFFVKGEVMEKKQFENAFAERYKATRLSDEPAEETQEPQDTVVEEKEEPGVGEEEPVEETEEEIERKKKNVTDGVDDEFDNKESYDQYKVNETDTNYEQEEEKKKKEFSKEQQEQKQRDQQKLRDMLK
ncbi:MAG: hypothetical protein K0R51_234 [Cytophagaceae bacterium]|nr:hypothetical protein [Cytophagaceae bacterium]